MTCFAQNLRGAFHGVVGLGANGRVGRRATSYLYSSWQTIHRSAHKLSSRRSFLRGDEGAGEIELGTAGAAQFSLLFSRSKGIDMPLLSGPRGAHGLSLRALCSVSDTGNDGGQGDGKEEGAGAWFDLGVKEGTLVKAMGSQLGILSPNELQRRSFRRIHEGKDAVLSSYTGSGKTLASLVPLIDRMIEQHKDQLDRGSETDTCRPLLLVITPTRELTLQILRVLEALLALQPDVHSVSEKEFMEWNSKGQLDLLFARSRPHVVVGTPKDLLLLLNQQAVALSRVKYMMMDEVDLIVDTDRARLSRLLDNLRSNSPGSGSVQTVLASATALAHPEMKKLIVNVLAPDYDLFGSSMTSEASIDKKSGDQASAASKADEALMELPPTLKHAILEIRDEKKGGNWATTVKTPEAAFPLKFALLQQILKERPPGESTLVFVNKKKSATQQLLEELRRSGVEAELLSGTRRIQRRNIVTWKLMEGEGRVVVATDELAARGLDYESVTLVVNFDLPYGVKNYLHRAGRAGRAGRTGTVISMVSNAKELRYLNEKLLGRLNESISYKVVIDNKLDQKSETEESEVEAEVSESGIRLIRI
eukprot:CAMPEP_0184501326 /NCGR_PEP_ID=MMETSP0113_2-20130426/47349_1 /TAXON_ID=91329 /ORGANISM="Norrisiella sphaerica, Strain BC52" /LENGTH=591 /DNA_ID=CAMNT_0026890051 /DNA_START=73 /DNA_END=1848 /DNA_ORIENTATION=+